MDKKEQSCDWWRTCQIATNDKWTSIAFDLRLAEAVYEEVRWLIFGVNKSSFWACESKCAAISEEKEPKRTIIHNANVIHNLLPEIIESVSARETSQAFLHKWGEFQKAVGIVEATLPFYEEKIPLEKAAYEREKKDARSWFSLWFVDYENAAIASGRKMSKNKINEELEKIFRDIWDNRRIVPPEWKAEVCRLLGDLHGKADEIDKEVFQLSTAFMNKFRSSEIMACFKTAVLERDKYPPTNSNKYEPIKAAREES